MKENSQNFGNIYIPEITITQKCNATFDNLDRILAKKLEVDRK